MKIDKEERIRRAEELFVSGYNCSQAVVAAFADLFGFTEEQGLKLSAGMGGGMGRLRMTCGAVSGMAILAGMDCGSADASDREGKSANYKVVQELLEAQLPLGNFPPIMVVYMLTVIVKSKQVLSLVSLV